jgi:hypothetical protein
VKGNPSSSRPLGTIVVPVSGTSSGSPPTKTPESTRALGKAMGPTPTRALGAPTTCWAPTWEAAEAPGQVVIVPIYKTEEESAKVLQAAKRIRAELVACNFRT